MFINVSINVNININSNTNINMNINDNVIINNIEMINILILSGSIEAMLFVIKRKDYGR